MLWQAMSRISVDVLRANFYAALAGFSVQTCSRLQLDAEAMHLGRHLDAHDAAASRLYAARKRRAGHAPG